MNIYNFRLSKKYIINKDHAALQSAFPAKARAEVVVPAPANPFLAVFPSASSVHAEPL